ncbi:hypothetical protein AAC387_Pa07g1990 [Persea americana]
MNSNLGATPWAPRSPILPKIQGYSLTGTLSAEHGAVPRRRHTSSVQITYSLKVKLLLQQGLSERYPEYESYFETNSKCSLGATPWAPRSHITLNSSSTSRLTQNAV